MKAAEEILAIIADTVKKLNGQLMEFFHEK
jgi:hypothetical protein